jgi:hypothetical protein
VQFYARLVTLDDETLRALKTLLPPGGPPAAGAAHAVDVFHPALPEILRAGDDRKGFFVSGEAVYAAAELAAVTHYELACRFIARESPADFAANDAVRKKTPLIEGRGRKPIRLMRGLSLSRISLKPNMVGSVGEWTNEYVAGAGVVQAFKNAGLTGVEFLPVYHPKSHAAHASVWQLFSDALVPLSIEDESVRRIRSRSPEEEGHLQHMGALVYESDALRDRPDFNRTCEQCAGWHGWPAWVVSARVKDVFTASTLRGWHFRPILTPEMPAYREYLTAWRALRDAVAATARSRLHGGRW